MTIQPVNYNLKLYKGADFCISFKLKDEDGNVIDLTGYDILFKAADKDGSAVFDYSLTGNPTIISVDTDNQVDIIVVGASTASVSADTLNFQIDTVSQAGAIDRRWVGDIEVIESV